jgi:monothiol glutaredoxin
MALNPQTKERIASIIASDEVVLFMKGNRMMPQCGFSGRIVQILDGILSDYTTVDVLEDSEVREGIKEYSQWPTIPQLYVRGEFIGGSDIVSEMFGTGELHEKLGIEPQEVAVPKIAVTDTAAARIREYAQRNPGNDLRLSIDARFQASLSLTPQEPNDIVAEANGLKVLLDPMSAARADGVSIDVVETRTGISFKIDNPNAPVPVKQLNPAELKKMLDSGTALELFDVRTPEERAIAQIVGARLLDQEAEAYIEALPKNTLLVFHCHHGGRSQAAADHFRGKGFTNVHNLAGGIDAWSREIDPEVPRY